MNYLHFESIIITSVTLPSITNIRNDVKIAYAWLLSLLSQQFSSK